MKRQIFSLGVSAVLTSATAISAEDTGLFVFKTEGEAPRVEARSVDQFGASYIYKLLGEDYVVEGEGREVLSKRSPYPIEPINPGNTPDDPPLTICACPEDYRASLSVRFNTPEMKDLLQRSRTVTLPKDLYGYKPQQIQTIERFLKRMIK